MCRPEKKNLRELIYGDKYIHTLLNASRTSLCILGGTRQNYVEYTTKIFIRHYNY